MHHVEPKQMGILSKFCLEDRVAVVTGAGRGIGEAIALHFAGVGANIVVAEINASTCEATAEKVSAMGRKALPITIDVTKSDHVQSMVSRTLAEFGRIDILVNNVGGSSGKREPMLDMPDDTWDSVIDTNMRSAFLCSKYIGGVMKDQQRGNIINMASCAGVYLFPAMPPYGAAKAGVINFTRSLAVYLAPYNIRVNCIAPGAIATTRATRLEAPQQRAERYAVPLGRSGYPEDIAFAAIYLASEAADYVTGIVIEVSGGPMLGSLFLKHAEGTWKIDEAQS